MMDVVAGHRKLYLTLLLCGGPFLSAAELSVDRAAELLIRRAELTQPSGYTPLTFHPSELFREIAKHGHELSMDKREELERLGFDFSGALVRTDRPQNLELHVDEGFFRFHYTLTGTDAVSSKDEDENGIPDYVDLIVETFSDIGTIDFDSLAYVRPAGDSWYWQMDNGGSNHYDVYIFELESGFYGYVQGEDYAQNSAVETRGDNEYSEDVEEERAMVTFMALRNDYDDFPGDESEIIQVTSAHEFFHAVQYGYDGWEAGWLLEATAVWMEEVHYDDVNDCYQFLEEFFKTPEHSINHDTDRGYGSYIYFSYLTENQTSDDLVKSVFERSREFDSFDADYSIPTVKRALRDHGRKFEKVTNSFLIANAILESGDVAGQFQYVEADSFPMSQPTYTKTITSLNDSTFQLKGQSVEVNAARYYKVDTGDSTWQYLTIDLWPHQAEESRFFLHTVVRPDYVLPYEVLQASNQTLEVTDLDSVVFLVSAFGDDTAAVTFDLEVSLVGAESDSAGAFSLLLPEAESEITVTSGNYQDDLVFAWETPVNFGGGSLEYLFLLTGDLGLLYRHFFDQCNSKNNSCTVPYHRLEDYLSIEEVETVTGTWDIVASAGDSLVTSTNGPFTLTIDASAVAVEDDLNALPQEFKLFPNFPNPFNPFTTINYDLPKSSPVAVTVHDVAGRKVRSLVNRKQQPGRKSVVWDATDDSGRSVSSGVYICRVATSTGTVSRKMVLLR